MGVNLTIDVTDVSSGSLTNSHLAWYNQNAGLWQLIGEDSNGDGIINVNLDTPYQVNSFIVYNPPNFAFPTTGWYSPKFEMIFASGGVPYTVVMDTMDFYRHINCCTVEITVLEGGQPEEGVSIFLREIEGYNYQDPGLLLGITDSNGKANIHFPAGQSVLIELDKGDYFAPQTIRFTKTKFPTIGGFYTYTAGSLVAQADLTIKVYETGTATRLDDVYVYYSIQSPTGPWSHVGLHDSYSPVVITFNQVGTYYIKCVKSGFHNAIETVHINVIQDKSVSIYMSKIPPPDYSYEILGDTIKVET